ncbi:hypothetical protein [Delftia tsuruhatensis]|uniref:hypothetical protein n=1 Tax=Delftia tsuruhatensis TaxID=180282 RepID=UPI001F183CB0|nr:hypothetical protein [Delftia tsuruhatensis]
MLAKTAWIAVLRRLYPRFTGSCRAPVDVGESRALLKTLLTPARPIGRLLFQKTIENKALRHRHAYAARQTGLDRRARLWLPCAATGPPTRAATHPSKENTA